MEIFSGQSWELKNVRDNFGNKDYIKIKHVDAENNIYSWGYYKNLDELSEDYGSHIYGSKNVLEDQLKYFILYSGTSETPNENK